MTDEMKANEEGRYIVVGTRHNDIMSSAVSEAEAKSQAERFAQDNHEETYTVYQRVGSAKVEPKVTWKPSK